MRPRKLQPILILFILTGLLLGTGAAFNRKEVENLPAKEKPRVIISTDIGGSDPDDFQSITHYLMYADQFRTEGLISSPFYFDKGSKNDIMHMLDLYAQDFPKLQKHSDYPHPDSLRKVVKQGSTQKTPDFKGWGTASEGSEWIIRQARKKDNRPLWILVWGGLSDVAQALHDAPEIAEKIRVYWIGGPNKKWGVHPYLYIAQHFPDLFMIENNSTYRGWILDDGAPEAFRNDTFAQQHIIHQGALGTDFSNYYDGIIKMGDTPSLAYLLEGNANNPATKSWGGSFTKLPYSAVRKFNRTTTLADTVPVYGIVAWIFQQDKKGTPEENPEIWMEIGGQRIEGFYTATGTYQIRFVPKRIENWNYQIHSSAADLDGLTGEFVSTNPWPGKAHADNIPLKNWWTDKTDTDLYLGEYQGAKTVSQWREAYLTDWAERLKWLE